MVEALQERVGGRFIDRLWRTGEDELLIRFAGQKHRLLVVLGVELTALAWTPSWPETPARPDYETIQLRSHLEGGRVQDITLADERRLLMTLTRGDGPRQLSIQLAGREPNLAVFNDEGQLGVALKQHRTAVDPGSPTLPSGEPYSAPSGEDWLEAYGCHVMAEREALAFDKARIPIARAARAWKKRTQRALAAVSKDLDRAEGADLDRHKGELIKSALGRIKKGQTSVEVFDYLDPSGANISIALDPALDPVENMQRYFRRYRKYRDATDTILERYEALERRASTLDTLLETLKSAESYEELTQGERTLRSCGWRPTPSQSGSRSKSAAAPLPFRRFVSAAGSEILVGRGSKHNDALTFKVAKGRDVWLHSRDTAGAHVILRAPAQGPPHQACLLDAATLAAWHSKARGEGVIDVMWTERKHVKKPKGAPAGRVSVSESRNIAVRMDKARVDRLYQDAPDH